MPDTPGQEAVRTLARNEIQALAEQGDPVARRLLAELRLAEPDGDADARRLLQSAAEAGDAQAQFRLGLLHARGEHGCPRDPGAAARWCQAAARQGLGAAQFNLALMHLAGEGLPLDAEAAARWLRIAAANGVEEAEDCLALAGADGDPAARPATWDEADTRISVVLVRSGSGVGKSLRFAEFYLDPCIDLLVRRHRFSREQSEDIVQQFMLELEEPLERGEDRGLRWKESLRRNYDPQRSSGRFRAYLSRVLRNFAVDWLRREHRSPGGGGPGQAQPDPGVLVEHHAEAWRSRLAAFSASIVATGDPRAAEAAQVVGLVLGDGLRQPEAAARMGLSERTVRTRLRLGSELLCGWLGEQAPAGMPGVAEGLRLLPDWLHYPVGVNRQRILLFLALVERSSGPAPPSAP